MRRPEKATAPDGSYVVNVYDLKGQQTYAKKYSAGDVLLQMTKTLYSATGQKAKVYNPECFVYPSGAENFAGADCNITDTEV